MPRATGLLVVAGLVIGIGGGLFSACTLSSTTTGAKTQLNASGLSHVRRLGVQVVVRDHFSVLSAKNEGDNIGFLVLGIVGAGIEHGVRAAADTHHAAELALLLGDLDCQSFLRGELLQALKESNRFASVIGYSSPADGSEIDGILKVEVNNWGIRSGAVAEASRSARVGLESQVSLVSESTASVIWQQSDYFSGGTVHPIEAFSDGELLKTEVKLTLSTYARRLANEIRFAR